MSELKEVHYTFAGSDAVISVDNIIVGECQEIRMREDLESEDKLIEGVFDCIVFDTESPLDSYIRENKGKDLTISIRQYSEDENRRGAQREIKNVKFKTKEMGVSLDQLYETEKYYFVGSHIVRTELPSPAQLLGEAKISE